MSTHTYYAVAKGRNSGIYKTWKECKENVEGYEGARFKKFMSLTEAQQFISGNGSLILGQLGITDVDPRPVNHVKETSLRNSPHLPDDIICFSDGSCLNNGKPNAKAGFSCVFPNHPTYTSGTSLSPTETYPVTNNRAEYSALIKAIETAAIIDPGRGKRMYFYTDSRLLIDTCTKWMASWKQKGWRKADGDHILNKDLVERIDALLATRKVLFTHVLAHTGRNDWASVWNDQADILAKAAASQ